jgi:ubiquinone/menaquinone biosynthesis C-methylase UbiE
MANIKQDHYVPALRFRWLTRFYDPVVALTTREKIFRSKLLDLAEINDECSVLDIACGSGTMAVLIKTRYPAASVTGIDGDPAILELAKSKARGAGVEIQFDEGMSYSMPYSSGSFDVVFSSLFFHHLRTTEKVRTLEEVLRILRPGGTFHICDWGRPSNLLMRGMFLMVRLLDGFEVTRDNAQGRLPQIIEQAGFAQVSVTGKLSTSLGTLDFISARKL